MTFVFDYALSTNTLNNSSSPYTWVLDTHTAFNDNSLEPVFVSVAAGAFTINCGTNPRFHVTVKARLAFEKQNTTDANDTVVALLGDSYAAPTNAYAYSSAYAGSSATPILSDLCADFTLTSVNNTLTIAPVLSSGPLALAYTLLSFTGSTQPYTTLQIICSFY